MTESKPKAEVFSIFPTTILLMKYPGDFKKEFKYITVIVNNTKCARMTYNNLHVLHIPKLLFIWYVSLALKWGAKNSNVVIFSMGKWGRKKYSNTKSYW